MDQKQTILLRLQELASRLKRTPSLAELECETGIGRQEIRRHFHSYAILRQAAGLPPSPIHNQYSATTMTPDKAFLKPDKKPKFDDLEEHLGEYWEKQNKNLPSLPTIQISKYAEYLIAATGDLHLPWGHTPTMSYFICIVEATQPQKILLPGDVFDMWAHQSFAKSLNNYNPFQEFSIGRKMLLDFIASLKNASPKSEIIMLCGNHCVRPMKRILANYPEGEVFFEQGYQAAFQVDGVRTIHDPRELTEITPGIWANHGHFSKLGEHALKYRRNMIVGHTHRPGTFFENGIWELNTGLSGDPNAKCFGYTQAKVTGWTTSFGLVSSLGPQVVPCF